MACGGGWMLGYLKAAIGCPSVTFRSSWLNTILSV